MDIKNEIIKCFKDEIKQQFEIKSENLSPAPNQEFGDFCLPCFKFVKWLRLPPVQVAQKLLDGFNYQGIVKKTEIVGGYINFKLNPEVVDKNIINEVLTLKKDFAKTNLGENKTVCIDFSSVNLAKYMHIGHLSTTCIGNAIRNIYAYLGFNTVAINYVGDYGTPFGKMITAYNKWGNEKDLDDKGVDYIQDLYIRFCKEAENNEELENEARACFNKIEKRDKDVYPIYEKFIKISIDETKKIYDLLNINFDSWRGESYYSDKMDDVINELNQKHLLEDSKGAKIVDLEKYNLGVCLIKKSDGSSLYATRDLAACEDRFKNYHFDKSLYVTDVSQKLHFAQFFKVLELLNRPYATNLKHIYYGRFSLPDGKIASRRGKQAILKDILNYSIEKTKNIVENNSRYNNGDDNANNESANHIGISEQENLSNYDKNQNLHSDLNQNLCKQKSNNKNEKICDDKLNQSPNEKICDDKLNQSSNEKNNQKNKNNLSEEEKNKIIKSVGVGAVIFSALKNEKNKDVVFDIDEALDFNGETSPYIQYTHARCCRNFSFLSQFTNWVNLIHKL